MFFYKFLAFFQANPLYKLFKRSYEFAKNAKKILPCSAIFYIFVKNVSTFNILLMKQSILGLIIVTLFIGVAATKASQIDESDIIKVGDMSPMFTVKMFDGSEVSIEDLKGKIVLLQFWATWCPPCRQELSIAQKEIIDRFQGKEFVYLPISREDTYEKIQKFREESGHTFPMGMDPDRSIYSQFATQTIPRNYILDKNGKVILAEKGYSEEMLRELITAIEKAL